jgi:hypothetical protein
MSTAFRYKYWRDLAVAAGKGVLRNDIFRNRERGQFRMIVISDGRGLGREFPHGGPRSGGWEVGRRPGPLAGGRRAVCGHAAGTVARVIAPGYNNKATIKSDCGDALGGDLDAAIVAVAPDE